MVKRRTRCSDCGMLVHKTVVANLHNLVINGKRIYQRVCEHCAGSYPSTIVKEK